MARHGVRSNLGIEPDCVRTLGAAFLLLALAMGMAAAGWFLRRGWGWRLTVAIIATQVVADLFNLLRGDFLRGPVGLLIAGALLVYLLRSSVRQAFPAHESRR